MPSSLLPIFLLAFFTLLSSPADAQMDIGAVTGTVSDSSNARVAGARVTLDNPLSGRQSQAVTDSQGQFAFDNVPYGTYELHIDARGFEAARRTVAVKSNVPTQLALNLSVVGKQESVTVQGTPDLLQEDSARTETVIDEKTIQIAPTVVRQDAVQSLVATGPGWNTENDGLMHIRGVDDGALYVMDGVPVPDRMDTLFAASFNTESISSLNVITGNIPAEFGDRSGAVVIVQPKSGLSTPLTGTFSAGAGSFHSGELSTTLTGGTKKWGFFLGAGARRSDRYLDPVDPRNFNNRGGAASLGLRADWHVTEADMIRLNGSTHGADFHVPNNLAQELAGQRQRQELRNNRESILWQHTWSANTLSDVAYFRDFFSAHLTPSVFDTPLTATQDRHHVRQGILGSLTHVAHGHSIKTGIETYRVSINEFFTFGITDPHAAMEADISEAAMAFTPAAPFLFRGHATRWLQSVYGQDDFSPLKGLTVNAGLRYDHSELLISDQQFSPRLGAVYYIGRTGTALRFSFNRLFMPPQVENLLLASSEQARQLSPFATPQAGGGGSTIYPESVSAWEAGIAQALGKSLRLNLAYWWRTFRNIDDPNVLFSTNIIFPNTVARARAKGLDVRLDVPERKGWSGYLSYTNGRITEIGPLNGGLFLTNDFIEIGPGTEFTPDHDQRNAGTFAVTYAAHWRGLWSSFTGRYESGVPIEVPDSGLLPLSTLPGADLVNFTTERVKPWTVFGWSAGIDLLQREHFTATGQFDVQNLADRSFVYNFGNPFSGTHFGYPRLIAGRLKFTFK
ncbi:MAG TPA: TonB-dependent receptor [Terriglobales bacterium]|nr:TonB-dependent receptor [Terriglobales bacterium]